jgi:5-methylcytosine-specific restriction endonuclease McrA
MTVWRMAFRVGNQGFDMFPDCFRYGVAAITYDRIAYTDLSKYPKYPKYEPKELWGQLEPTQKASLWRLVYEMKKGDVIYVKHGKKITCKGVVRSRYRFDRANRIVEPGGVPWSHQVPVSWDNGFPAVEMLFGAEEHTVHKLSDNQVQALEAAAEKSRKENKRREADEGKVVLTEAAFRSRNAALIAARKANSDYKCEVCGFRFLDRYGKIAHEYIIAHHLVPLASRKGISKTTLDDIALLCANCHAMVHTTQPPHSLEKLRRSLKNA